MQDREQVKKYAQDWLRAMWDMDVISHEHWDDGLQEAEASLASYMEGLHLKDSD